jgi:hypothetical protein
MKDKKKPKDELPEAFATYEEAGEFWDTHDSTDYAEHLVPVTTDVDLKRRHFEIELDEDVVHALEKRASSERIPTRKLANELLKKELVHH